MQKSDEIDQLATALSAAQAEIEDAEKAGYNPGFRSNYADLGAVVDACKPALTKHGLAFSQVFEESEPGTLRLTTILMHKSGQWLAGTCAMPLVKQDPQGYGSAATYARRYGLAALVGVCPQDDDANAASQVRQGARQEAAPRPAAPRRPVPESSGDRAREAVERQEQPVSALIEGTQPGASGLATEAIQAECEQLYRDLGGDPTDRDKWLKDIGNWLKREVFLLTDLLFEDWEEVRRALRYVKQQRAARTGNAYKAGL